MKEENRIAKIVVDGAIVHRTLGPGLLESAYQAALAHVLISKGLKVELEKSQPVLFEETKLDVGYRLDMFINKKVIIELKAVEELNKIHMPGFNLSQVIKVSSGFIIKLQCFINERWH